jgi:hypothetical protein
MFDERGLDLGRAGAASRNLDGVVGASVQASKSSSCAQSRGTIFGQRESRDVTVGLPGSLWSSKAGHACF